jgi:pyruvate dehydrogenase complex dehydrogenase (E1) component
MYVEGEDISLLPEPLQRELYDASDAARSAGRDSQGFVQIQAGPQNKKLKAHIFGSGPILRQALRAQDLLAENSMSPPMSGV